MTQHRIRVGLLVPSLAIDDDADIATPALTTLVDALGSEIDLRVFPLRLPAVRERFQLGSAEVQSLGARGLRLRHLVPRAVRAVLTAHRQRPFDVLHGMWLHEPGTLALLAGSLLRVATLLSIGGAEVARVPEIDYGGALDGYARGVNRRALRYATLVSGGSEYVLRLARELCPERHAADFRLAPLPVNTELFIPSVRRAFEPRAPRLLHAASLVPVKDQTLLLRAFALVANQLPDARLDIAGEDLLGARAALERLRDDLGQRERVCFLGAVPHTQMAERYRTADLFLLTSWHESQGMVALEASACGTPVVGSAVGVVPDLAPDAAIALVTREPADFAASVLELLCDRGRLDAMRTAARREVERRYATGPATARFVDLYTELSKSTRR